MYVPFSPRGEFDHAISSTCTQTHTYHLPQDLVNGSGFLERAFFDDVSSLFLHEQHESVQRLLDVGLLVLLLRSYNSCHDKQTKRKRKTITSARTCWLMSSSPLQTEAHSHLCTQHCFLDCSVGPLRISGVNQAEFYQVLHQEHKHCVPPWLITTSYYPLLT